MSTSQSNNHLPDHLGISTSTLLEDAELAIEKLNHQEIQLVRECEELFKRQVEHIKLIDRLQNFIPNMTKIDGDTKRLLLLVDSSSTLVEDVCSKVRRLDLAKARLEDCLQKVGDILDLNTCRSGMFKALEVNNYEEAAMHIKRFLAINQEELQKTISILCDRQQQLSYDASEKHLKINNLLVDTSNVERKKEVLPCSSSPEDDKFIANPRFINSAFGELEEARSKLLQLCQQSLEKAIEECNTKDIERFFKIFPMLNEHQDGLKRYAEYLQSKIVNPQTDETFKSKKVNQADKLAALYESIAKLIDANQPLVETYYGPGYLIVVVRVIQRECDHISRKILEEFCSETKLQHIAKIVKNSSLQAPLQSSFATPQNPALNLTSSRLDPREVDNILNEISTIISRSGIYLNFIIQRVKEDINFKSEDRDQRQSGVTELYDLICEKCELNRLVQEVEGIYVMLEQYYLNESSKKAITMDQIDVESSQFVSSSMLDDIFFIIKKCTKRAISTKSIEVFCAIINHCVTLLESMFCQILEDRLKNQQYYSTAFTTKNLDLSQAYNAIQSGRYLQSASEFEMAKAQFFSSLNNLDKACEYIQTLCGILDVDTKKLKPSLLVQEKQQDNQMEKSRTCLNELSQLVNKFSSVVNSSLYQLFNASLRNRLKTELKTVIDENPDLITSLISSPSEATNLSKNLLTTLDRTLQESLTPENYSKLTHITKDFLVSSMAASRC